MSWSHIKFLLKPTVMISRVTLQFTQTSITLLQTSRVISVSLHPTSYGVLCSWPRKGKHCRHFSHSKKFTILRQEKERNNQERDKLQNNSIHIKLSHARVPSDAHFVFVSLGLMFKFLARKIASIYIFKDHIDSQTIMLSIIMHNTI